MSNTELHVTHLLKLIVLTRMTTTALSITAGAAVECFYLMHRIELAGIWRYGKKQVPDTKLEFHNPTELPGSLRQVRAHSGDLPIAPESLGAGPGRKNLYVWASFEVIQ